MFISAYSLKNMAEKLWFKIEAFHNMLADVYYKRVHFKRNKLTGDYTLGTFRNYS